jgi:hypothetical protein
LIAFFSFTLWEVETKYIMTADIDYIVMEQIVAYINDNSIIKDNFNTIKELIDDNDGDDKIRYALTEFFDGTKSEEIVNDLYNTTEGFLSHYELRQVLNDGEQVLEIMRRVYQECKNNDTLDIFGQHLLNNNMSKMCDLYMYFGAEYILNDIIQQDELLDKLVILYEEEELEQKIIEFTRRNAINKIKRNAIYNNGLGLKLAIKAYSKDF